MTFKDFIRKWEVSKSSNTSKYLLCCESFDLSQAREDYDSVSDETLNLITLHYIKNNAIIEFEREVREEKSNKVETKEKTTQNKIEQKYNVGDVLFSVCMTDGVPYVDMHRITRAVKQFDCYNTKKEIVLYDLENIRMKETYNNSYFSVHSNETIDNHFFKTPKEALMKYFEWQLEILKIDIGTIQKNMIESISTLRKSEASWEKYNIEKINESL